MMNTTRRPANDRLTERTANDAATRPALHPMLGLQQMVGNRAAATFVQTKLTVGATNDPLEREADRVADRVTAATLTAPPGVQRKCTQCVEEDDRISRSSLGPASAAGALAPAGFEAGLQSRNGLGAPLSTAVRSTLEPHLGRDLTQVRIHTGAAPAELAKSVSARAFTHRNDIYFAAGEYQPQTPAGRHLLTHELAHVIQQGAAGPERVSRKPTVVGTKFTHPAGSKSAFKTIAGDFDGRDFVLKGDGTEILRTAGQSGRPVGVRAADAKACKGSTTDSYLNDPRYVGIQDHGAIPEGVYQFKATEMATFTAAEQAQFTAGGSFVDPFGASMHGGDWGAGRVALKPIKLLPGPKGCGNTSKRSGFFLHGGILAGSSGCIDVGNGGIASLTKLLAGHRGQIKVTVSYKHPAPGVSKLGKVIGGVVYPGQKDPSILDRLKGGLDQLLGD